ncbi:MAG: hypothetical protein JWO41_890 [Candidatus Saccharibacteria bacterium]|nr:hypothetical protein [Candidatus Saccharibacteria bacterium]
MADINVQMPSENEDFDATSTGTTIAPTVPAESTPDFSAPATEVAPETPAVKEPEAPAAAEPVVAAAEPKAPKERKAVPVWPIVTAVLALAVIALGFYSFTLMNSKKDLETKLASANANPQLLVQKQTDDLISKVSHLMTLPSGETPTVANVSDAAKAKQQSAFFANAQNGDRVLMYVKAGEAILYRPSTNKIILVAPLTFNNTATTTTPTTSTTKK